MLLPLSLCALAVHQETAAEPPAAPPLTPQLVVRVPDVPAAWRALQDSPWARLLQDEAILAVLREQWGEPDLTLQSLWSNGAEQGRVGEELLGALELLAGLRSATIGIAVRPGSIDAPRNEWQPAEMLLGGQVALVLDVDDEGSIPRWRAALDGYFGRPDVRARLGEAGTAWTVEGTRAVLRVGDLSRVLPIDALVTDGSTGAPGGEASRLPDATGGVLADVWVAPFHELHLFESAPFGIALARLLGLLVGLCLVVMAAVALAPDLFDAHRLLALTYLRDDASREALPHLERAHELAPRDWQVRAWLGIALGETGEARRAYAYLLGAARERPEALPLASTAIGLALRFDARRAAIDLLRLRLAVEPIRGARAFRLQLAWLLATAQEDALRDGEEAVRVLATLPAEPDLLGVLAAAQAEAGRFDEALQAIDAAIEASSSGRPDLRRQRQSYVERRPWRE